MVRALALTRALRNQVGGRGVGLAIGNILGERAGVAAQLLGVRDRRSGELPDLFAMLVRVLQVIGVLVDEEANELAAFREAVRNDDGQRVSLADLRAELND